MKPLSELGRGEYGYIVDMKDSNITKQLFDLGCFPGDLIRVETNLPERDFITFRCHRHRYHLSRPNAEKVITNTVSFHFCMN